MKRVARPRRSALCQGVCALAAVSVLLALLPVLPAAAQETVWRLERTRVNPDEAPEEYYGGGRTPGFFEEERFKDMQVVYGVSAEDFRIQDRWQDREYLAWDVSISCGFEAPEETLAPGSPYELTAGFSHAGMMNEPHPGELFVYYSPSLNFVPNEPLAYYPSAPAAGGSNKTWTFTVPSAEPGATMQIFAGLVNVPACTVVWEYVMKAAAPGTAAPAGGDVLNPDCTVNEAVFDRDWKKYSDIDERIELESRSWEAQKIDGLTRKIAELESESLRLQAEIVLNGQVRREARELRKALVSALRANLIKSLFRLSILTADAVKSGYDLGTTYAGLFTLEAVETLPEGLELLQDVTGLVGGLMPEGSEAVSAVSENAGDLKTALETIMASDEEAALTLMNETLSLAEDKAKEALPSWDTVQLSPEDISILENQYLHNQALDEFLKESYAQDRLRSARVRLEIPAEIERLRADLLEWEGREKQRVRERLIAGCKENK